MTYFTKIALISVFLIFAAANSAEAGIVNNSGSLGGDSVVFSFSMLDTLGNPVARATGDSLWVFTFYPGGSLAAADSCRILSDTKIAYRQTQMGSKLTASMSYTNSVANLDGGAENGIYAVLLRAYDSSLALVTDTWREFQLVTHGDFANILDSAAYGSAAGDSITVDKSNAADIVLTRSQPDSVTRIDGVERDSLYAITNRSSDTITYSPTVGAVNTTVNADVQAWLGSAPATLDASGFVKSSVEALLGVTASATNFKEAFDNDNVFTTGGFEAVVDSVNPAQKGQQADSTWGTGHSGDRRLTSLDEDDVTIDLNATTIGTVTNLTNNNPNLDGATGTLANSQIDDDVDVNAKTVTSGAIDSADFAADAKKMIAIRSDSGIADITTASFAAGAIDDAAVADGAIDWGGELDTTGFGLGVRSAWRDTLTTILAQLAVLVADTSQSLSLADSALISRVVGRKVWGTAGANGSAGSDSTASGTHNVRVLHWAGSAATDTVRASDSGGYAYPHIDLRNWMGRNPSILSTEGYVDAAVQTFMDEPFTLVENGTGSGIWAPEVALMNDAIQSTKIQTNAIQAADIHGSAALEIADSTRRVVGDSLSATKLAVSEIQSFLGACDECYQVMYPLGGSPNKDSAIVIDGSISTSDSLLGKVIFLHGTSQGVADTALFYTRPWW